MKLAVIIVPMPTADMQAFVAGLASKVLAADPLWYFLRDAKRVIIRCSPAKASAVEKYARQSGYSGIKREEFIPAQDEYPEVRYIAEDLTRIFHATALAAARLPGDTVRGHLLERTVHILVNQSGLHNFLEEAGLLATLSLRRAWLAGKYQSQES